MMYNTTMSKPRNETLQLGMNFCTAQGRLRKLLLFSLVQRLSMNTCFRCNQPIATSAELSMEHKIPWLHSTNPVQLFFDLENIAFSHLRCNSASARYFGPPSDKEGVRRRANAHKRAVYSAAKNRKYYLETYSPTKRRERYLKSKRGAPESN